MTDTDETVTDKAARRKQLQDEIDALDSEEETEEVEGEVEEEVDEVDEAAEEIAEGGEKTDEETEQAADEAAEEIAKELGLTDKQMSELSDNIANNIYRKWKEEKNSDGGTGKPKERKRDKAPRNPHFTERRISLRRKGA